MEFKKKQKLPIPREAIVIKRIDGEDVECINFDALTSEQRQLYIDGQYEDDNFKYVLKELLI